MRLYRSKQMSFLRFIFSNDSRKTQLESCPSYTCSGKVSRIQVKHLSVEKGSSGFKSLTDRDKKIIKRPTLPPAIVVGFRVLAINVVIHTPETADSFGV